MSLNSLNSLKIKFLQIIFGGGLFAIAFYVAKAALFGSTTNMKMLGAIIIGVGVLLALDKNYWILCPLLQVFPFSIPGLPFDAGEIGCLMFISMFLIRSSLRFDPGTKFRKEIFLALPYFLWVCFVWCLNPTGVNILGSSTIGARFYFKIVLAFITLCLYSRIRVSEKECKYVFIGLIISYSIKLFLQILGVDSTIGSIVQGEKVSQYFLIEFGNILLLLLCCYEFKSFFRVYWRFWVAIICLLLTMLSGKRTIMGQVIMSPFILAIFRGKERAFTFTLGAFLLIFFCIFSFSNGHYYNLPLSVQRALSFMPGNWDSQFDNYGTKDLFREELHKRAKVHIKENPWVGRRGFAMSRSETIWINASQGNNTYIGHDYAGNWHNKFWGMGADFGLPASFSWYFFSISAFLICWKRRYNVKKGKYRNALFLYYLLFMIYDLIFAFGHSALTAYEQWVYFAILLSLLNKNDKI